MKNTYSQDFEYLEVNEQDLRIPTDPEVASVNSHGADAATMVETDNKRRKMEKMEPSNERVSSKHAQKQTEVPASQGRRLA